MRVKSVLKYSFILMIILMFYLSIFSISYFSAQSNNANQVHKLETRVDVLPYPLSRGAAVWVDDSIYIFGGRNETDMLDRIMKYTPSNNQLGILDTHLPTVLMGSTAVYDGEYIYILGGKDYDKFYQSILRFDPKTNIIKNMTSLLPKPTVGAAAVWTGEYIYFFGGCWGGIEPQKFDTIIKYDPTIGNITILGSKLPYGRSGLAATWDGEFIYLIGGSDGKQYSADVYRYSPKNDTLETLPGKLPTGRLHIQAEFHNGSLYIFGGRGAPTVLYDQIVRYDLDTDKVEILKPKLTNPTEFRMHTYDGKNIYLIGGFNSTKEDINQFIIFTPGAESTNGPRAYCPPDESQNYIGIILLILIFVVAIILNFWHMGKKKQSNQ